MKCECKECEIRSVGCHSKCKSYQEFKKYNDDLKEFLRLGEADEHIINNHKKIGQYLSCKKKKSKRVGIF